MKPWEKYQKEETAVSGPWGKYGAKETEAEPEKKTSPIPIPLELMASHKPTAIKTGSEPSPILKTLQNLSPYVRAGAEGGGSALGALMAGGAALPTGPGAALAALGGGTGGYMIGNELADLYEEFVGTRKPPTLKEKLLEIGTDARTGATLEMGGAAVGAALIPVLRGGKWVFKKAGEAVAGAAAGATGGYVYEGDKEGAVKGALAGTALGLGARAYRPMITRKAGQILAAHTSEGIIFAENAKQAAAIEKEIPGLKFTIGQRTADPNMIKLERSQMRKPGPGAALNAEQIAVNNEALRAYYQKNFPGKEGIDDLSARLQSVKGTLENRVVGTREAAIKTASDIGPRPGQETGVDILQTLDESGRPIKAAMGELEAAIPDYPMKFDYTDKAIQDVLSNKKISVDQQKAVERIQKDIEKVLEKGKSTHTAFGVRRTLNDEIDKAFSTGKDSTGAALMEVKTGLERDLLEIEKLARTGKIAEYKGQPVFTDELAKEYERNAQRIASSKVIQEPDVDAMVKAIDSLDTPHPPTNRIVNEGESAYAARISRDYKRFTGKDPINKAVSKDADFIEGIKERNKLIEGILADVEPGKTVASSMKAYNDFASKEWFGRFKKGSVKQATAKGTQATGTAARIETIPGYFTSPSGADDLIRAIGDKKAGGIMKGHYAYDLLQNATSDGAINSTKLSAWMKKNAAQLEKYGIKGEFDSVAKSQAMVEDAAAAATEFERGAAQRILNADPEKAIGNAIKGNNAGKAANDLLNTVKGDPAAVNGLKNAFADHIMTQIQTTAKDVSGNPIISNAAFQRTMEKYAPAMKALYRDEPQKLAALNNMRKAYEIAIRNTRSPIGGGSDTAENVLTALSNVTLLSRSSAMMKGLWNTLSKYSKQQIDDLVTRAIFDPDYADTLVKATRGKISEKEIRTVIEGKIIKLDDYRKLRLGAAAAGIGAATTFGND